METVFKVFQNEKVIKMISIVILINLTPGFESLT